MAKSLVPDAAALHLEGMDVEGEAITLVVTAVRATACCPVCGQGCSRVHSHYRRTIADLPWQGLGVRLDLQARRWFCPNPACARQIFAERSPAVVAPYARRTARRARVAGLFPRRPAELHPDQQAYLDRLQTADAAVARERGGDRLDAWLAEADTSAAPALKRFATGLRADLDAVRAGLTERWSNGPTAGFVHKLKLVKRLAYGRAGCAVLRRRTVLAA